MTVTAVLTQLAAIQKDISGIRRAYDGSAPPDSLEDLPAAVSFPFYPSKGTIEYPPSRETMTYPVTMRFHLTRQDLKDASAAAVALIEPIRAAFRAHSKLGGIVQWSHIDSVQLGAMQYAGEDYYGLDVVLIVQESAPTAPAA